LTQLKDPASGELIFNVVRIGQICKDCAKTETPWTCEHKNYMLPPWKSSGKTARMKAFYGEGDEHKLARETYGLIASGTRAVFAKRLVDEFERRPLYHIAQVPRIIYCGIDPGGGGPGQLGITFICEVNGIFVVSRWHTRARVRACARATLGGAAA